jgi:hypothetical protein
MAILNQLVMRCFLRGINIQAKFDFVDKQDDDCVMQNFGFGKADGFSRQPFDLCPKV